MEKKVVHAYRNLNRRDGVFYSVRDAKTNLVIAHVPFILLSDVQFRVQEGGRLKVIAEKRKRVHAYIVGTWETKGGRIAGRWEKVRYNPYLFATFVRASDNTPVYTAEYALLDKDGARAVLDEASYTRSNPLPRMQPEPPGEADLWNG